jgi:hypothetical protein
MLRIPRHPRLPKLKAKQYATYGIVTAGAAAMAVTLVPGSADAGDHSQNAAPQVSAQPVAFTGQSDGQVKAAKQSFGKQLQSAAQQAKDTKAATKSGDDNTKQKTQAHQDAAAKQHSSDEAANRSADRAPAPAPKPEPKPAPQPAKPSYPDNLDGWIRQALDIMHQHGIPGTYEGIHRNIMRESGGNPNAVNDWDINAQNGVPSKGLLQVIWPTFKEYHVPGTSWDLTDPVANITAACNYAAHRYGSMDNVDSAY